MSMTKAELLDVASSLDVDVPSKANKQEIINLIEGR